MRVMTRLEHMDSNDVQRLPGARYDCADVFVEQLVIRGVVTTMDIPAPWDGGRGRVLSPLAHEDRQYWPHELQGDIHPRALALTLYDPGSAAYRYHSAANCVAGGVSAFGRFGHDNPHCDLRQWDGVQDALPLYRLAETADVLHVHMGYEALGLLDYTPRAEQVIIRHYHGSIMPQMEGRIVEPEIDDAHGAVQIGARLYHQRFSDRMHWLPIPVPVREYAAIAARHYTPPFINRRFRICHSPTNRRIKGTRVLEFVMDALQVARRDVELVMIEGRTHAEALALKATCDVTFDSFWLGIQGSGLEAAAMGQMVIAGDPAVRDEYTRSAVGCCPYTYANTPEELEAVLLRAVTDGAWRAQEAARVQAYTTAWHDYVAVGARYWHIVHTALGERAHGRQSDIRTDHAAP